MKTNQTNPTHFLQSVSSALEQLKLNLQEDYEHCFPALREIVQTVLEEEEAKAWDLSPFPHLIFPDLVEAELAKLDLRLARVPHQHFSKKPRRVESPNLNLDPVFT